MRTLSSSSVVAALLLVTACDRTIDRVVAPGDVVVSPVHRNSALGVGDVRTILGPQVVTRTTGTPTTETFELQGYAPDATLRITNGDANGRSRVTSGTVLVDGQEVVHPSAFGQKIASIVIPITLRNASVISVSVAGSPGDQLTLSVDGSLATSASVSPAGGTIHLLGSQVTLAAPAGAVGGTVQLTATPVTTPRPEAVPGTSIDLGPTGTVFSSPVTLSIAFDPAALPVGVRPTSLRMKWWNVDHWEALPGNSVDVQRGVVSATTKHFTEFALLPNEVVFCPGDANAENDLRTAITHVPAGGTVYVCDGTFAVARVLIDRPMTLRSQNPGGSTLVDGEPAAGGTQRGEPILRVDGVASGLVRIADLAMVVTDVGVLAEGTFDRLEIANVRFTGVSGSGTYAVVSGVSSEPSARVDVSDSDFRQLQIGLFAISGVEANVQDSRFDRSGVTYSSGNTIETQSNGRIEGNVFTNCGVGGCVSVLTGEAVIVARNRFEAMDQPVSTGAITISRTLRYPTASQTIIEDNVIVSRRTDLSASTPAGWMFQSGISVSDGTDRTYVVRGNHVTDAYSGITSTASVAATDNWFTGGVYAIRQTATQTTTFQRNDAVGLLGSFTVPTAGTSVQCNWWGSTAGPAAPPTGTQWAYTPWAGAPIAGTSVACTPVPVPSVPPLVSISIGLSARAVLPGGLTQFVANGRDASNNVVPIAPVWSVVNGGGSVSAGGHFTAGMTSGVFTNTVRATVGTISATASVAVGAVARVDVGASSASVPVGTSRQFSARAFHANGYTFSVPPTEYVWSVANGGGSISSDGVFTAGSEVGTFANSVTATYQSVSGAATVTVIPPLVPVVRVCGTAGVGVTVPTVAEALGRVQAGGTVLICDGTHTVNNVTIAKSVTITAEGPGRPTLDAGGGDRIFMTQFVPSGTVTISKLRFTGGAQHQIMLGYSVPAITISDNEFQTTASQPYGGTPFASRVSAVWVAANSVGTVTLDHNSFVGGDAAVDGAWNVSSGQMNVMHNEFRAMTRWAVFSGLSTGTTATQIEGNTFEDCGDLACLFLLGSSRVVGNTFTANLGRPVSIFVHLAYSQPGGGTPSVVTDNIMTGVGISPASRNLMSSYPVSNAAIMVMSGAAEIARNRITNAYMGIHFVPGESSVSLSAIDNVVQRSFVPFTWPIPGVGAWTLTANWNDFTDYVTAFSMPESSILNLRCNWWGYASGPTPMIYPPSTGIYTPFVTSPVAGLPHTGCTP